MRTAIKKTKVYKFDELPEDGKEKAIENLYDINVDYEEWYEDDGLLDLSKEEIKNSKIKMSEYKNLIFNWDKLYFSIDREWYIQFIGLETTNDDLLRKFLRIPKPLWDNCHWYFDEDPGRETNSGICSSRIVIEPDYEDGKEFTAKQQEIIDNAEEIMNDKISEALKIISDNYDYLTSRKSIINTIKANDYEFSVDGKIY